MDERQRARLLRRDPDLERLLETINRKSSTAADDLLAWAAQRDAERRSLANEALERYTELNLLYDMAERSTSLDPATIIDIATSELRRAVTRGKSLVLLTDDDGRRLRPIEGDGRPIEGHRQAQVPADGFPIGEGIVGGVASGADGEIVNDPATDPRALDGERALGALMVAPLRAGTRRRGVLLVVGDTGTEFTAGEFRLLSAVAALTASVLDAALLHVQAVAAAREREQELQRQLDALRSEVEERRREERVSEITGSDYFRSLRQQADTLRSALNSQPERPER